MWVSKAVPVADELDRDVPRSLTHEVGELLARVFSCFTEGLDTPGLKEAGRRSTNRREPVGSLPRPRVAQAASPRAQKQDTDTG